jgi:DNA polymerase I-like protein with 3'-5' exonuclease and polymerase domains
MTKLLALDIETTGLDTIRGHGAVLGYCLYNDTTSLHHSWTPEAQQYLRHEVESGTVFICHNAEFDIKSLRQFGVRIPSGQYYCTKVLSHGVCPIRHQHSLASWGEELDYPKATQPSSFLTVWDDALAAYCMTDTKLTWYLWEHLSRHLTKDTRLADSYYNLHMPFVEVMMSLHGGLHVELDRLVPTLSELLAGYEHELTEFVYHYPTTPKLKKTPNGLVMTGKNVTPNTSSPLDIISVLLCSGWKPKDYTPAGLPATSKAILNRDLSEAPEGSALQLCLQRLLKVRALYGLQNNLLGLAKARDSHTGYIFGSWNQTGTDTHRLSSSEPNMQNVSARHPVWGPRIRGCFTPPPGYSMLVGDLSQIELSILAYYLELVVHDSSMAEASRNDTDFHDANASNWYNVASGADGFKQARSKAKNGIFASNYGAGAAKLSLTLGISYSEALEILTTVKENLSIGELQQVLYSQLRNERDVTKVQHENRRYNTGFFYDVLNTRHFYPAITATDQAARSSAERRAFNCLMQGGCASIFYKLCTQLEPHVTSVGGWFAGLVHDEAIIYVPTQHASDVLAVANQVFASFSLPTPQGGVKVKAEFSIVPDWSHK